MNTGLKFLLVAMMSFMGLAQTGCASGGYKLTRKYSQFVNKQQIILRVILYILTLPVYGVTLLIDGVIFNTMDFWEGRVSANTYQFEEAGKVYAVEHTIDGRDDLRKTEIKIFNNSNNQSPDSVIVLQEQVGGKIKVMENNQLKAIVDDIYNLPKLTLYKNGVAEKAEFPTIIAKN